LAFSGCDDEHSQAQRRVGVRLFETAGRGVGRHREGLDALHVAAEEVIGSSAVQALEAVRRPRTAAPLADCNPRANASEMFIPEPEIEFDIRSIIADQVRLRSRFAKTRIDNLASLPARFGLARGSTSACG
jgi:hypothetical protein